MNKTVEDKRRFRDEATSLRNKLREAKHSYNIASNELVTISFIFIQSYIVTDKTRGE